MMSGDSLRKETQIEDAFDLVPGRYVEQEVIAFDDQDRHVAGNGEGIGHDILEPARIAGHRDRRFGRFQGLEQFHEGFGFEGVGRALVGVQLLGLELGLHHVKAVHRHTGRRTVDSVVERADDIGRQGRLARTRAAGDAHQNALAQTGRLGERLLGDLMSRGFRREFHTILHLCVDPLGAMACVQSDLA